MLRIVTVHKDIDKEVGPMNPTVTLVLEKKEMEHIIRVFSMGMISIKSQVYRWTNVWWT